MSATAAALLLAPVLAAILAGCGGNGQISVAVAPCNAPACTAGGETQATTVRYKPGSVVQFVVTVVNNGPGDAPGVNVVVAMPSTFRYTTTDAIDDQGSARTEPLDAREGSSEPQWGFWDIAAPPAKGNPARINIRFHALVAGPPNSYNVVARAQGDNTAGVIFARALVVQVIPAPKLSLSARVDSGTLHAGDGVNYRITVSNTGSTSANGVAVLVTLPPVMVYQSSIEPFAGNASRSNAIDPVPGAVEAFYSGFTLPAASGSGPGYVVVVFRAQVVSVPESGTFPINVQVTDGAGDIVTLNGVAPVTVVGAPST